MYTYVCSVHKCISINFSSVSRIYGLMVVLAYSFFLFVKYRYDKRENFNHIQR